MDRLHRGGMRIAVVERELIGGECAYWACFPSKTLIRPTTVMAEAGHVAGVATPAMHWEQVAAYRDEVIHYLDDSRRATIDYRESGDSQNKAYFTTDKRFLLPTQHSWLHPDPSTAGAFPAYPFRVVVYRS